MLLVLLVAASRCEAEPVRVSIAWEQSWPVVTPATAGSIGFVLKNEGRATAEVSFSAILISPSGVEEKIGQAVTLAANEEKRVPFSLESREMGIWGLRYKLTQEKDPERDITKAMRFAYMEAPGSKAARPDFLFGIVSHSGSPRVSAGDRRKEIEAAAFAGCKVLRCSAEWSHIQPHRDEWKWEVMDELVTLAGQLGMELQVVLAYTAEWAAPAEKQKDANFLIWNRAAPNLADWRKFVFTYADRYKGRIRLWEPWNEPDLSFWRGTTEEYISLLRASAEELRRADPANLVMSGGFATLGDHPARKLNPDLQERTMKALGSQLDFHAVHEHGSFARFAQLVDGPYAELRASLPSRVPPLFFNETAEHSVGGTEEAQAETLVKKATFARSRGAVGYLWYDLRNDGTDPGNPEHNYGLLTNAMEPKPAYVAFSVFARLGASRSFLEQLEAGENRWFFLHGDANDKLLIYWNDDDGSQNEQIMLRMPEASKASLIDINGNATSLPLVGGLAVVPSSGQPRYLLAEGAKTIRPEGRLAGPSVAFFGAPGSLVTVACEFMNPTREPATVQTKWTLPMAMELVKPASKEITLPPGGRVASSITVRLPDGKDYKFGSNGKVMVNFQFSGLPYRGRILIPVHYGTIVIPAEKPGKDADIVLDRQEQLVSFIEADPHMLPYRWKGPDDLSARAWLRTDGTDLILRVEVTDNTHYQDHALSEIWRGDSVQCVLAMPKQKGNWEMTFAEDKSGQPVTTIGALPSGQKDFRAKIRMDVDRRGGGRTYTVRLPREELGLGDNELHEGFRLNLAVNDNDGMGRAHALQLAPGIVSSKSLSAAPYVVFKKTGRP